MKYLKVHVEGCHVGCDADLYTALDPETVYGEDDLDEIGRDMVNEHIGGWGREIVDEADVPEGER